MTSVFEMSISAKDSVRQLRAGHRWLTEQHRLWLAGDRLDGDDAKFSRILDDWDDWNRFCAALGLAVVFGHLAVDARRTRQ